MSDERDYLLLKWGSLKGWSLHSPEAQALLQRWIDLGVSMSAVAHHDTPEQKELICQIIDAADVDLIQRDWDGEWMTKDEAKRYVIEYGEEVRS